MTINDLQNLEELTLSKAARIFGGITLLEFPFSPRAASFLLNRPVPNTARVTYSVDYENGQLKDTLEVIPTVPFCTDDGCVLGAFAETGIFFPC